MAIITVPTSGATVSNVNFNDTLQAPAGYDLNSIPLFYEVDGSSTLQSLTIGYDIEVDVGFTATGSLRGTGNITGPTDPSVGNLPLIDNYGTLDINGTISTSFSNDGQTTVSAGERLNLAGDFFSLGTITVAATGELDLNSPSSAFISQLTLSGKLKSETQRATLQVTTNTGTIDVAGGTLTLATSVTGAGTIIVENGAKLDTSQATSVSGTVILNAGSKLTISQLTSFTGVLQSPASATIDLVNLTATGASVANGKIVVTTGSGTVSLNETGSDPGHSPGVHLGRQWRHIDLAAGVVVHADANTDRHRDVAGKLDRCPARLPVLRQSARHAFLHRRHQRAERDRRLDVRLHRRDQRLRRGGADRSQRDSGLPLLRHHVRHPLLHRKRHRTRQRQSLPPRSDLRGEQHILRAQDATDRRRAGVPVVRRQFRHAFYTGDQNEYNTITKPGTLSYRPDLKSEGIEFYAPIGSFS